MIPNQWYVLMESKQVKDKPVGVTRMGNKMVFWRDGEGKVSCLRDRCPHRGVELSKGMVLDGHLQCPFHGFEYDASGRCVLIPANGRNAPVPRASKTNRRSPPSRPAAIRPYAPPSPGPPSSPPPFILPPVPRRTLLSPFPPSFHSVNPALPLPSPSFHSATRWPTTTIITHR